MIAPPAPPRRGAPPDPELLIEEAREHRRRRRRRSALAALVVAGAAALAGVVVSRPPTPGVERVHGGPTVDVAAFVHHGRLAFVSRDTLWVLDGRSLRRAPKTPGLHPLHPSFSPDGHRLAWIESDTPQEYAAGGADETGQLWLADGDGRGAAPVAGLAHASIVGWGAGGLAVLAGPISTRIPFGSQTTLRLIAADGRIRTLVHARDVRAAVWSPDGRRLAIVTQTPRLDSIVSVVRAAGRPARVWARWAPHDRLDGMNQIEVDAAGWWRGFGIGLWVFGDGMTHNNDETPLYTVAAPFARPRFLAEALSDGTTRVVAAGARALAVVADVSHGRNGGRVVWDEKELQICPRVRGACVSVTKDPGRVTLDPAWSPGGNELAFVEAPDRTLGGWDQRVLDRWSANHVLRVYDLRTHALRTVAGARGATVPEWAPDGDLLYEARDGLWLLGRGAAKPVEIASPLFRPNDWPSYYGQIPWPAQFAWRPGS